MAFVGNFGRCLSLFGSGNDGPSGLVPGVVVVCPWRPKQRRQGSGLQFVSLFRSPLCNFLGPGCNFHFFGGKKPTVQLYRTTPRESTLRPRTRKGKEYLPPHHARRRPGIMSCSKKENIRSFGSVARRGSGLPPPPNSLWERFPGASPGAQIGRASCRERVYVLV